MKKETQEAIEWVLNNFNSIPKEEFKDYNLSDYDSSNTHKYDNKKVLWLVDDEDGTVENYETSQQRLGINEDKQIVWGFTSGCSCWDGWSEQDYANSVTYKEFILKNIVTYNPKDDYWTIKHNAEIAFSEGWEDDLIEKVNKLKEQNNETKRQIQS